MRAARFRPQAIQPVSPVSRCVPGLAFARGPGHVRLGLAGWLLGLARCGPGLARWLLGLAVMRPAIPRSGLGLARWLLGIPSWTDRSPRLCGLPGLPLGLPPGLIGHSMFGWAWPSWTDRPPRLLGLPGCRVWAAGLRVGPLRVRSGPPRVFGRAGPDRREVAVLIFGLPEWGRRSRPIRIIRPANCLSRRWLGWLRACMQAC